MVTAGAVGTAIGDVTAVGGAVEVDGDAGQGMTVVRVGDGAGDDALRGKFEVNGNGDAAGEVNGGGLVPLHSVLVPLAEVVSARLGSVDGVGDRAQSANPIVAGGVAVGVVHQRVSDPLADPDFGPVDGNAAGRGDEAGDDGSFDQ